MQVTQKKKLSKGTWVLLIFLLVAVIAVAVCGALGVIDLTFLADLIVGYAMFGTISWMNGALIIAFPLLGGMVFMWILYRWFIGQKVTVPVGQGYNPQPTTPTQSGQSGTDTVIS